MPIPLLCAGQASPAVLRPDVESSVQGDMELCECIQSTATNTNPRMEPLSCKQGELGCSASWRSEGSKGTW